MWKDWKGKSRSRSRSEGWMNFKGRLMFRGSGGDTTMMMMMIKRGPQRTVEWRQHAQIQNSAYKQEKLNSTLHKSWHNNEIVLICYLCSWLWSVIFLWWDYGLYTGWKRAVSWKISSFKVSLGKSSSSISNLNGASATGCQQFRKTVSTIPFRT